MQKTITKLFGFSYMGMNEMTAYSVYIVILGYQISTFNKVRER
jgi:hypothetical protein